MADQNVPARWRVLGVLNGFFINNKACWASNEWLGEKIGAHKDTVSQAVKELEEMNIIKCERTRNGRTIRQIGDNAYPTSASTPISDRRQRLGNADRNADKKLGDADASQEEIRVVPDVEEKPTKPKKFDPKVVFDVFSEELGKSPLNWRTNKTQRTCAENLFKERGIEQIRKALEFYRENRGNSFCPSIHSPYDLDSKWAKLFEFKKKEYGD